MDSNTEYGQTRPVRKTRKVWSKKSVPYNLFSFPLSDHRKVCPLAAIYKPTWPKRSFSVLAAILTTREPKPLHVQGSAPFVIFFLFVPCLEQNPRFAFMQTGDF